MPSTDQRGALRNPTNLNNGTTNDAGSYEVSSSYLVTSTGDSLVAGTLRSAFAWADNNPSSAAFGPSVIRFDPTVFGTPQTINLSDALGTLEFTNTSEPMVIDGPGASLLSISGDGTFGLLSIATGGAATLTGLTLSGGGGAERRRDLEPGIAQRQQLGLQQRHRHLLRRCHLQQRRQRDGLLLDLHEQPDFHEQSGDLWAWARPSTTPALSV